MCKVMKMMLKEILNMLTSLFEYTNPSIIESTCENLKFVNNEVSISLK